MQPLKQRNTPTSPIEAQGIELLRAARGFSPAPGAKQRVRARLVVRGLGRRAPKFRAGVVVLALLGIAGTSLAFSGGFLTHTYQRLFDSSAATSGVNARSATLTLGGPNPKALTAGGGSSAALLTGGASSAVSSAWTEGSSPAAHANPKEASSARRSASEARGRRVAPSRGTPADETRLVFDAMRALRQEGRPDRASRLLDEYMSRFPAGPLTEEAMALSIEAKTRSGDPRAKDLATVYLSRFPSGQFRTAAERARARFSP